MSAKVANHADIYVVEWYDEWGDIIDTPYYFWQTMEDFVVAKQDVKVMQLRELDQLVKGPTVVTDAVLVAPNGKPYEDLYMRYIAYITNREQTWSYDLSLVDMSDGTPGKPAKPNTPVWVYLPYPEGHKAGTKYKINHYIDGSFEDSALGISDEIEVQDAVYGLAFQTDSFSPFILSANDSEPSAPPRTGDATPILWLTLTTSIAACGMLMMRKKTRKV